MTSGWLLFRRVGNAASRMVREARHYSTHQPTKPRGVVAYGTTIVGGAAVLYSVERCYRDRGQCGRHHAKDSTVSAMEPPRNAPHSPPAAPFEGITGRAAAYADLMVCSSEKADLEYMFVSEASWGGGGPIDFR
jgi:hypothetical protein